jgi:DNA-binding response OmpR family regulator
VIVLDVMMPGLDGWRVAEELLADAATSGIPIVFLSARADTADRARGIELGGIDYITKPFDPTKLSAALKDAIGCTERGEREEFRQARLDELRHFVT